jgi:hypothetical protein
MIVYRDQRARADPRRLLATLRSATDGSTARIPSLEAAREVLIEAGRLESAINDALFPDSDGINSLTRTLRHASVAAGHALWHTWHRNDSRARDSWDLLSRRIEEIDVSQLPSVIDITIPEGYAYYAVYPEMYLEAAKRCSAVLGRGDALCIGLRSIGTSLSAAVAAALEELGCRVESVTLRPRGHPFSRYPCLSADLVALLRPWREAHFLVVDEGPGISGSSMGGTAAMLRGLGVDDDRVILFPSWETEGSHLQSEVARERWSRCRRFSASFDDVWLRSGHLGNAFPGVLHDLSAGAWRQKLYSDPADYPPVHPQHERRKYLLSPDSSAGLQKLLKFGGFGRDADRKVRRAEQLAEAGFTLKPEMVAHGFVVFPFLAGTPVSPQLTDPRLVDVVAAYLAHLCREQAAEPSVSDSSLRQMIAVNVAEGLGDSWLEKIDSQLPSDAWTEHPVALDGRMLPHEWIRTASGFLKTDAMDHHDDHFFPGCQDIAWDVASAALELGLDDGARHYLVERYRVLSGDRSIASRLHTYAVSYLGYRLGYATLAAGVLGNSPDGSRFGSEVRRYRRLLEREVSGAWGARWSE